MKSACCFISKPERRINEIAMVFPIILIHQTLGFYFPDSRKHKSVVFVVVESYDYEMFIMFIGNFEKVRIPHRDYIHNSSNVF